MLALNKPVSYSHLLLKRQVHGNAELLKNCVEVRNRNPRNLERLRIARKPAGYHLDDPGHSFWHKLELIKSSRYLTAEIIHFENGPVITASTQEWGMKKQLYRGNDVSAYINVARLLAQRALEAGISEMQCKKDSKQPNYQLFLDELAKSGISFEEPEQYVHPFPSSWRNPEKSWTTFE